MAAAGDLQLRDVAEEALGALHFVRLVVERSHLGHWVRLELPVLVKLAVEAGSVQVVVAAVCDRGVALKIPRRRGQTLKNGFQGGTNAQKT